MAQLDEVKDKLRKLISKEESAREMGSLEEADSFASKIQELLLRYQLDIEELKDQKERSTTPVDKEKVDLSPLLSPHEADWIYLLYAIAAENNFCKVIMPARMSMPYVTLIGEELNREFTHYFVNQLVSKLRGLARTSFKTYEGPDKRNTYIRSFLKGAVAGIRARLRRDREQAKASMPQVNALVLDKGAKIIRFMHENYPPGSLGTRSSRKASSSSGYSKGFSAGESVSINKGMNGGTPNSTKYLP